MIIPLLECTNKNSVVVLIKILSLPLILLKKAQIFVFDASLLKETMYYFSVPQVKKCDDPVSVTASMNVPNLDITWSHSYTSNDIVAVPGFTVSLPSILSAGVYVQVDLSDDGSNINMKVSSFSINKPKQPLMARGELLVPLLFSCLIHLNGTLCLESL